MTVKKVSSASVYYRHGCWNHRYVKMDEDGRKEYGTMSDFEDEKSATESFWKYLQEYRKRENELRERTINLQQELYDEEVTIEYEENYDYESEDVSDDED